MVEGTNSWCNGGAAAAAAAAGRDAKARGDESPVHRGFAWHPLQRVSRVECPAELDQLRGLSGCGDQQSLALQSDSDSWRGRVRTETADMIVFFFGPKQAQLVHYGRLYSLDLMPSRSRLPKGKAKSEGRGVGTPATQLANKNGNSGPPNPTDDKTAGDWPSVKESGLEDLAEEKNSEEDDSVENRAPWKLERTLVTLLRTAE
ncbi:uncharacterized protein N7458_003609 [Penicillium daleae]|uniref:Uncharacterized protein n=1 Tax=Penicillium daleae TaxID=63821 RepID=A0AAD6CF75_9EURO|nr:uncharacterized protein N7458_003609 [Penicillium daleae]KAJ5462057.1 hypothetical protein N7458_003609 [Penicillium daleae]